MTILKNTILKHAILKQKTIINTHTHIFKKQKLENRIRQKQHEIQIFKQKHDT